MLRKVCLSQEDKFVRIDRYVLWSRSNNIVSVVVRIGGAVRGASIVGSHKYQASGFNELSIDGEKRQTPSKILAIHVQKPSLRTLDQRFQDRN